MQTMHVDIAGPLQRGEYGERYIIERSIGTVKQLLRAMIDELGRGWPELLQGVLLFVRSAVNRSSGYTPHYIFFRREMCFPNEQRPGKFLKDNSLAEYVRQRY